MRALKEADIQRYFKKRVREYGGLARKVAWEGRRSAPDWYVSFPDIVPNFRGYTLFVELKAPGERPRADQRREHARLAAAGTQTLVFDSCAGIDAWLYKNVRDGNITFKEQENAL